MHKSLLGGFLLLFLTGCLGGGGYSAPPVQKYQDTFKVTGGGANLYRVRSLNGGGEYTMETTECNVKVDDEMAVIRSLGVPPTSISRNTRPGKIKFFNTGEVCTVISFSR